MQKRAILVVLARGRDILDVKGNFSRKEEWMNPKNIHDDMIKHFEIDLGRDKITKWLDSLATHEKKFVERKSKKDEVNPAKKKDFIESKAQREFKINPSGVELLKKMNDPDMGLISDRF